MSVPPFQTCAGALDSLSECENPPSGTEEVQRETLISSNLKQPLILLHGREGDTNGWKCMQVLIFNPTLNSSNAEVAL